jgi:hypothetical protein
MGTLTEAQAAEMVRILSTSHERILFSSGSDPHTLLFADDIQRVFQAAGWTVERLRIGSDASAEHGLICGVEDPAHIPPAADKIIMAFKTIGMNVSIENRLIAAHGPASYTSQFKITLYIGRRP